MAQALAAAGVAERLQAIRERIAAAARRCGRDPAGVTLVGVSKRKPAGLIAEAVRAGLVHVAENYVQEAAAKLPELASLLEASACPPPRRHLIGHLQRNKARDAVRLFDVVESVDRAALGEALDRRAGALERPLDVLVQVDLAGEPQKGGVPPEGLAGLLTQLANLSWLRVQGLMTIPPATTEPEQARPWFARLRDLRDQHIDTVPGLALAELSMGMSADFEVAIEEGATWVRVGTAIFGPREDPA